jgi:hypothetical protein
MKKKRFISFMASLFILFLLYLTGYKAGYEEEGDCINGRRLVKKEGKFGYTNWWGIRVIPLMYDDADWFSEDNHLARVKLNGKYGFIDKDNKFVIGLKYEEAGDYTKEGLVFVRLDNKCGYIDTKGNTVIPFNYDKGDWVDRSFHDGLAVVCLDKKYGVIDKTNNIIIPFEYDEIHDFSDG